MNLQSKPEGELARPTPEPAMGVSPATASDALRIVPTARGGALNPTSPAAMSPMSILRALRRRSALALGVAILMTGTCGPAAWFLVPPAKFKARARLQVIASPPKVLFQTGDSEGGGDYMRYQSTQRTLVKSQMVLKTALQDGKVSQYDMIREQVDPIAWLQEALVVEFVAASEVMEISLSGDNPQALAAIVNAVKKAYMEEIVNVDLKRRADRHAMLRKTKERYTDMLKTRRDTLRKLAESVGSDDRQTLALRQQYAIESMAAIHRELAEVQSQKRKLEAQVKMRRQEKADEESTSVPSMTHADVEHLIDNDPSVQALADKLAQVEETVRSEMARLKRATRNFANEPARIRLQDELDSAKRALATRRKVLRPIVLRQLQERGSSEQVARGGAAEQELAVLTELESRLTAEIKSVSDLNRSMTVNTLDLQAIQDEVAQMQEVADKAGAEVEALNVELEAPPRIRLIEDAAVPQLREEKKRYVMIAMITAGSFFASIFGIAFLEMQSRKVDTADEVPAELGLTVVGALPVLPPRARGRGMLVPRLTERDRFWQNLLLESVDATRTMLLHAARAGSHRAVMIASAVGGEGKTSLSTYLATSLAQSGLRTLLIDADLRHPSVHRIFELPQGPGLSELLRGEVEPAEAIIATPVADLNLIPGGRCDRHTIRVLTQGGLGPFLEEFKERYDFIIVDSSPILPVADASIIAQQVDAVLFSIFRDVSSKTKVHSALSRLQSLGVQILGAVVTGAHTGLYYGSSYYGSSAYYTKLPESAAVSSDSSST